MSKANIHILFWFQFVYSFKRVKCEGNKTLLPVCTQNETNKRIGKGGRKKNAQCVCLCVQERQRRGRERKRERKDMKVHKINNVNSLSF